MPVMSAVNLEDATREGKREAFRRDTLAEWEEYTQTGLHVTIEEVAAWVARWGPDEERDAPVCRR